MKAKTIQLELATAKRIYNTAAPELKAILEENFGKSALSGDPMELIQTMDDVFELNGTDEDTVLPYDPTADEDQKSINAYAAIKQITRAYNQDKILDWDNSNQPKYYLYFQRARGEWVLRAVGDVHYCADLGAGSYFVSEQHARDAYKKFKHVWDDYLPK